MKAIYRIIKYVMVFSIVLILVNYAKPYWNRFWLEKNLETVAIFGTKHGLHETKSFLMDKIRTEGYSFNEDDFIINKDERNRVSINFAYVDEIRIFGKPLKKLQLSADVAANEVKTFF